jgi:hypothetical protein
MIVKNYALSISVPNENSEQSARPQFTFPISTFCQQKNRVRFQKVQFPRTLLMLAHSVIRNTALNYDIDNDQEMSVIEA